MSVHDDMFKKFSNSRKKICIANLRRYNPELKEKDSAIEYAFSCGMKTMLEWDNLVRKITT